MADDLVNKINYGGFIQRLIASFIDIFIICLILFFIYSIYILSFSIVVLPTIILNIIILFIFPLYNILLIKKYGTTIGKYLFGLYIVDKENNKLTAKKIFIREIIGKAISSSLLNLGYVMIIFDKQKQGLHDKIVGSFVIQDSSIPFKNRIKPVVVSIIIIFIINIIPFILFKEQLTKNHEIYKTELIKQEVAIRMKNPKNNEYPLFDEVWFIKKDPKYCKQFKIHHQRKNCVEYFGLIYLTEDYCNDFDKVEDHNLCLADVAAAQKDISYCYKINESEMMARETCYLYLAEALKDEKICTYIKSSTDYQNTCILNVGIALKDSSYCDRARDQDSKDNCLWNIFSLTKEKKLCDQIIDPMLKESCTSTLKNKY